MINIPVEEDYFETYTGGKFNINNFTDDDIEIQDIAHSLSLQCRFNGHCKFFYSVAQHSTLIAKKLMDDGYDPETCLMGLLHDATEAYLCDIPRPIKPHLTGYRDLENKLQYNILKSFMLPTELPDVIREYDIRILASERRQVMNKSNNIWAVDTIEPLDVEIKEMDWVEASQEFLNMFIGLNFIRTPPMKWGD